jgi:hypothetical protein
VTEKEWLECADPTPMLEFFGGKAVERKLQLFVCAACRRHWPLLEDECLRNAVESSERYADGTVDQAELARVAAAAWPIVRPLPKHAPGYHVAWAAAWSTAPANRYFAENASAYLLDDTGGIIKYLLKALGIVAARQHRLSQAGLLCDIFGNPFRPITVERTWLTPNVVAVAQTIYEERRFQDMPILADALEEPGCTNADILNHCRGPGPHVRGCWVVDLILGKQ